jgi:tRNA (guanine37-N1)-methyltransferase
MMNFDILTIFPDYFETFSKHSIIGRAVSNKLISINPVNIRDFSLDKHKSTDDVPFGGGSGMLMTVQPILDAYNSLTENSKEKKRLIYLSPQGKILTQKRAQEISKEKNVILLCGNYEGIDERIINSIVDEEISIGDYVLTGGELAAEVFIDCVARLIPGVLGDDDSSVEESHSGFLLEYPQYTRPSEYNGIKVPEILLSGHHANIEKWKREQSLIRTYIKRPDLFEKCDASDDERKRIIDIVENLCE